MRMDMRDMRYLTIQSQAENVFIICHIGGGHHILDLALVLHHILKEQDIIIYQIFRHILIYCKKQIKEMI